MVEVGVAYDYLVHVFEAQPDLLEIRDQDLLRRPGEAGVHEDRPLLPDEEVLAHKAGAKVGLDAVDARQDLQLFPPHSLRRVCKGASPTLITGGFPRK